MNVGLHLGTASWGLKTSKLESFHILDYFSDHGFKLIDTATNYPISGNNSDFGLAISWLEEWVSKNSDSGIQIFIKIGSTGSSRDKPNDLSGNAIKETVDNLRTRLSGSIYGIGVHWDNRDSTLKDSIFESIHALKEVTSGEMKLGISGIRHPEAYEKTGLIDSSWMIQVKEHQGDSTDRDRYKEFFPYNQYIAYGLSHYLTSRTPFDKEQQKALYFEGLQYTLQNEALSGFIVGPSNLKQLEEVIDYCKDN